MTDAVDGPDDHLGHGPPADPEAVARTIVLNKLSAQPRTRHELAEALARRRVPTEVAERVLDRFEEVGLVDDAAFARSWVESRHFGRGLAKRALAQELRRKGVADEVAADALDQIDAEDESVAARALVRRRLRTMTRLDDPARLRRLTAMLARRGYPSGMAMATVREELSEDPDGPAVPEPQPH
ncbi:MAG: regulatory protein RecX [Nocardioidaceae bacterium]